MKKSLLITALMMSAMYSWACTNLIVGKKASKDGSVICTYNCDGFAFAGSASFVPAGKHAPGEKILIDGWGPATVEPRYVDQVDYTYNVVGLMNEHQVSIVETTFDGRLELVNEEGYLDYFTMMNLALQRSTNAREAILCMTDLVRQYGYNSSGETITICDPENAWIMEIIGKGPGNKGAVWVALRIPDDCICAHANISRIRQFTQKGKKLDKRHDCYTVGDSVIFSSDVIEFARLSAIHDAALRLQTSGCSTHKTKYKL